MSPASLQLAGILLILIPTVVYGGVSILYMWITRGKKYYVENPLRQRLWRAGHAHAGVLLVLSLVMLLYVDQAELPSQLAAFVRSSGPPSRDPRPVRLLPLGDPSGRRAAQQTHQPRLRRRFGPRGRSADPRDRADPHDVIRRIERGFPPGRLVSEAAPV